MLVEMRTSAQAQRVAAATGCPLLPGKAPGRPSRRVDLGARWERHLPAVQAISVLFHLFDGESPVPSGWTLTGATFEVHWPKDRSVIHSHFGARRFTHNWALAHVKADL